MKRILLIHTLFLLVTLSTAFGQITVTNTQSPSNYVQNILLGTGVTANNITYNGSPLNAQSIQSNISYFNAGSTTFPIASGILVSTGAGTDAMGPNNSGSSTAGGTPSVASDADLNAIANAGVTNGAVLEFDFVPAGDTVSFRYLFGSDEYPEFANSSFNDAFGFFLSGPGLSGPYTNGAVNIATIPGTGSPGTPVTINNVNATDFPMYYVNNVNGAAYGPAIEYDGTTVVLTAVSAVQCGETYHIKIAICNVSDQSYDSGVFIEADSFTSDAVEVSVATVTGDTSVVEDCTSAEFVFVRSENMTGDSLVVNYMIAGNAIQGTDYNNLPGSVIFEPGEDTVIITLTPIGDGIVEGTEFVTISAMTITECNDTIISIGTLYILDTPYLTLEATDPTVLCPNDSVVSTIVETDGGLPPYTYAWSQGGQTGTTAYLPISTPGSIDYTVTVTDQCGFTQQDIVTVTYTPSISIDSLQMTPSAICVATGTVTGYYSGTVGPTMVSWTGPGSTGAYNSSTVNLANIPAGEYFFTVINSGCSVTDSIDLINEAAPVIGITESDTTIMCPTDSAMVTAQGTGGAAPYTYNWNYLDQNGPTAYVPNLVNGTSVNYIVTATDACGLVGMDTVTVTLNQTLAIDTMYAYPASACNPDGAVSGVATGITGVPLYNWTGPGNSGPYTIDATVLQNIPSGWYYFTVTDNVCSVNDSVFVSQNNPPVAAFTPSTLTGCDPLTVTFTNTSQNATTFAWDFGNGQTTTTNDLSSTSATYTAGGTVRLIASQGNCSDTAYAEISISTCGCTDPAALNYNPQATVSDNSCYYATPTVIVPNVFTPDNNGANDFFELITTNAVKIDVTITNRWGNVVFKDSGASPKWDGKSPGGEPAEDGVYFVVYNIEGTTQSLEGHSFFHLER